MHVLVGLVSSINLLLLLTTGLLLQHRDTFKLDERMVARSILPRSYRPQDDLEGVRADILVADLHSGRLWGRTGALVVDGITLGWLVLLASGVVIYAAGRWPKGNGAASNGNGRNSREG